MSLGFPRGIPQPPWLPGAGANRRPAGFPGAPGEHTPPSSHHCPRAKWPLCALRPGKRMVQSCWQAGKSAQPTQEAMPCLGPHCPPVSFQTTGCSPRLCIHVIAFASVIGPSAHRDPGIRTHPMPAEATGPAPSTRRVIPSAQGTNVQSTFSVASCQVGHFCCAFPRNLVSVHCSLHGSGAWDSPLPPPHAYFPSCTSLCYWL